MANEEPKHDNTLDEAQATEGAQQGSADPAPEQLEPEHLTGLLEDARAKADEHWNQLLRAQAEMENLRRRTERDLENAHKFALEKFAQELLPVRDSLEMGLAAATGEGEAFDKLREGMDLTLKMLSQVFDKFGIAEVDPQGEAFNPDHHQAMSMQESAEHAPNTVMLVMQKGYLLNDRLIRPALVVVSKAAAGGDAPKVDEQA